MRRPAALFFLLIFSATLSNAHPRRPITSPSATPADAQRTTIEPTASVLAAATNITTRTKRLYKSNLKVSWACAASNAKVVLTHKKSPDISIQALPLRLPKKASKSVVVSHASTDGARSIKSVQFKGGVVALYSPQLSAGNSSPTANKPPGS